MCEMYEGEQAFSRPMLPRPTVKGLLHRLEFRAGMVHIWRRFCIWLLACFDFEAMQ
jgi:hypothetical protein